MLVNQSKAASIAGVSRMALSKLSKREPPPLFFISHAGKLKIDTDNKEWHQYCNKHESKKNIKSQLPSPKKKTLPKKNKPVSKKLKPDISKQVTRLISIINPDEAEKIEKLAASNPELIKPLLDQAEKELKKQIKKESKQKGKQIEKEIKKSVRGIKLSMHLGSDKIQEYQDFFKTKKLQEEALIFELKRKNQEKSLIDVEMGQHLFISFIEQVKAELGLIPNKIDPLLEGLYQNKQSKKAVKLMRNEFSGMIDRVLNAQEKSLKEWKKDK